MKLKRWTTRTPQNNQGWTQVVTKGKIRGWTHLVANGKQFLFPRGRTPAILLIVIFDRGHGGDRGMNKYTHMKKIYEKVIISNAQTVNWKSHTKHYLDIMRRWMIRKLECYIHYTQYHRNRNNSTIVFYITNIW